jgi:serine/threonine-protein kinase
MEETVPQGAGPTGPSAVPSVLMEPVTRRLRFAAGVAVLLWFGYLVVATDIARAWNGAGGAIGVGALFVSLAMFAFTHRQGLGRRQIAGAGTLYLLLTSLALALGEFADFGSAGARAGASWSAVWIVLFPLLIPCGPKRTLAKTLIAASMTPFALWVLLWWRGLEVPPVAHQLLLFAPVYVAALVATLASHLLMGLGTQVTNAHQMGMYELEEPVARGGMGEVWKAKHQLLSRPAAIKLVKHREDESGEWVLDEVAQRRFEREAQVTANLQSPHTVQLYDFGVTQTGTFYYVMELLDGVDLDELVKQHGPLAPERVVHILEQALDSLAEAHSHGLVHRDIKPANLHLSRRGLRDDFVKVLDFGLVKLQQQEDGRADLTAENSITGTPAYLAPEIVTAEGPVDGRADLYALGAVAYFLLTGKFVFEAKTPMQMAIAHVTEPAIPPSQRTERPIPGALERLVMQCLEKHPQDRPESAVSVLRALESLELQTQKRALDLSVPAAPTPSEVLN